MSQYPPTEFRVPPQAPPGGGMAITAFVLALIGFLVCPPLGLVALILGIIALSRGTANRGLAIASVCIAPCAVISGLLFAGIMLPALGAARQAARQLKSSTQLRAIGQGLIVYAQNNRDAFPELGADWRKRLTDAGLVPTEMFEAPGAEPGRQSYFYNPVPKSDFSATTVLVYENPDLWHGRGMNVCYTDNHTDWVTGEDYRKLVQTLPKPGR
jgi:hypothetical protein